MQDLNRHKIHIMLNRLKLYHDAKTDSELAGILGVKQNTLSTWKRRGSANLGLITRKSVGVNLDWLVNGSGEMQSKADAPESPKSDQAQAESQDAINKEESTLKKQLQAAWDIIDALREENQILKKKIDDGSKQ